MWRKKWYRVTVRRGRWIVRIRGRVHLLKRRRNVWFYQWHHSFKRLSGVRFLLTFQRKRHTLNVLRRGEMIVKVNKNWGELEPKKLRYISYGGKLFPVIRKTTSYYSVKRNRKLSRPIRVRFKIKKGR